jgi:DMSO reductase family type II enzyme heme b subunit
MEISVPSHRPEPTEENILEGKRVYNFRCSPCHGVKGDGNGPVAATLEPRPRDFTGGNFRFRTTKTGEVPKDEDMFRTITRGIPGTAMPSWATLSADDRWQVIYYVKKLSGWFDDEEFSPYREEAGLKLGDPPPRTEEIVREGEKLFKEEGANCIVCHGIHGRGNGTGSDAQKKNAKRERLWPRDLTKFWRYKNGSRVEDIFRTLTGGLTGTPMPSSLESLHKTDPAQDEYKRWAIAYFVESLFEKYDEDKRILEVVKVDGKLPTDAKDPAWERADEIAILLTGQLTFRPRWQTPAIDFIRVRALYNDEGIALRLVYNDRTRSTVHESPEVWTTADTYPELDVTKFPFEQSTYRDAVAIQFPVKDFTGAKRPYFIYGSQADAVHLLRYEADKGVAPKGVGPKAVGPTFQSVSDRLGSLPHNGVVEYNAKGRKKLKAQPDEEQQARGTGVFDDGQWQVVFQRPLVGGKGDAKIAPGAYIPFTLMAWDGGNGESGLQQSVSSWYSLKLVTPISARVYIGVLIGILLATLTELYALFRVKKMSNVDCGRSTVGGRSPVCNRQSTFANRQSGVTP